MEAVARKRREPEGSKALNMIGQKEWLRGKNLVRKTGVPGVFF
jgi:hypothetical protein